MPPAPQRTVSQLIGFMMPHTRLNKSLRVLIGTGAILNFIVAMFSPFYAVFVVHIGGTVALAGLAWALYSLVAGVLIFLFADWQLKIKEQELLIALGHILRGGVFLSYAFMATLPQLFATQILWGIASALAAPAFDSVYAQHTDKADSIVQWGGWEGISAIMIGFGALIGGIVIQVFGYPIVFVAMAVISLGLGTYIWMQPRDLL